MFAKSLRISILLLFCSAVLLGCGSASTSTTAATSSPSPISSSPATTEASSPPSDIATAARELASLCVPAAESGKKNPAGVGSKVQALIAAYVNDPTAPGAREYVKVAEENLKDGCGTQYAGRLSAILSSAGTQATGSAKTSAQESQSTSSSSSTAVATGHASGEFAIAQVAGTAENPSHLKLRLTSIPAQSAQVTWTLVCQESGGGVGSKSGQATRQLPTTEHLPLPAPSDSCTVSANAQLSRAGTVTIAIQD
jgi:hypothetical protein